MSLPLAKKIVTAAAAVGIATSAIAVASPATAAENPATTAGSVREIAPIGLTSPAGYEVGTAHTITGTAAPGAELEIAIPSLGVFAEVPVTSEGTWSYTTPQIDGGVHGVLVVDSADPSNDLWFLLEPLSV